MNSKSQTLDPKMKEIYDRVMNTVVAPPSARTTPIVSVPQGVASTSVTQPIQQNENVKLPTATTPPATPQRPVLVTEQTTQAPLGPEIPIQKALYGTLKSTPIPVPQRSTSPSASYTASSSGTKDAKKNNSPLMPILFTVSGLVFFIVYAIFWIKFFDLPVPFLPI